MKDKDNRMKDKKYLLEWNETKVVHTTDFSGRTIHFCDLETTMQRAFVWGPCPSEVMGGILGKRPHHEISFTLVALVIPSADYGKGG